MKKLRDVFLLAVLLCACQKPLFDKTPSSLRFPSRQGHASAESAEGTPSGGPDIFATALCFQKDTHVLLFKNGKRILEVPACAQPERHRYKAGHLWTDFTDGSRTVLFRDGEEVFRFDGEELFLGFSVADDGHIHTLGQRQGRDGFCYRIDGKEQFSAAGTLLGSPMDREWPDGAFSDNLHYCYGIPVWKGSDLLWEYHLMHGKELVRMIPASQTETVYDIRYYKGTVFRSEQRSGGHLCLVRDDSFSQILQNEPFHLCKLVPYEEDILVKGYSYQNGIYSIWLRDRNGIRFISSSQDRYFDLLACQGMSAYILLDKAGAVNAIWKDRGLLGIRASAYEVKTPLCCDFRKGVFAAALSSLHDNQHVLLTDTQKDTVSFDGYFTSLQIL